LRDDEPMSTGPHATKGARAGRAPRAAAAACFALAIAAGSGSAHAQVAIDASRRTAIVSAAERAGPGVVSITTVRTRVMSPAPLHDEFFEPFFRELFPARRYEVPGLGSGFIIDPQGYVVSNDHVVRNAESIRITLPDGRELDGTVIGSDPSYDIAVIKVEGKDLPAIDLGDSDALIVGEWAIAIGNPFGFLLNDRQPSVTAGVISATHRDVKAPNQTGGIYKDMIQTDAAINPGNSGGPLVNGKGEVIGVNTFIFSSTGGSLGIGFAIPINTVKRVVDEIIRYGEVRDIWIGISVQEISPFLAEQLAIQDRRGLVISAIDRGSPAYRAGIRVGDVIRAVNGTPVLRTRDAQRLIFGTPVGGTVRLDVEREGKRKEVRVEVEAAPGGARG
jgi:serine protease Do